MEKRCLFASLIGINAYKQNALSGCIKDVLAIDLLLREQCNQQGIDKLQYEPKYFLAPTDADKKRIATYAKEQNLKKFSSSLPTFKKVSGEAFEHLKKAKDGDICVFYYSGHGSQAEAPQEFWHLKGTRQNETLVCFDSRDENNPLARDLVDKEFAFLLWDALGQKKLHCLVIMDCCHSGSNTRDMAPDTRYRLVPASKTKIPFTKYLGFASRNFYEVKNGKANIRIARYIHLAAAMDTEKAQESSDGGLFTSKLVEVLRAGGTARTYRELMRTVGTTVSSRNAQQNPVPFALVDEDLDQQFLGNGIRPYLPSFEVRYYSDPKNPHWRMYGGAMHGIVATSADSKTTVTILGHGKEIEVKEVLPAYSILDENAMSGFDINEEDYKAVLVRLGKKPLQVGLSPELIADKILLKNVRDSYKASRFIHFAIKFEDHPLEVDYLIYPIPVGGAKYFGLTLPENRTPIFKEEKDASTFLNNVEKVGRWITVSNLKNTNSKFTSDNFVFTVEKLEGIPVSKANHAEAEWEEIILKPENEIVCNYVNNLPAVIKFSISIAPNGSFDSCFLGALYLDCRFGISYNLVRPDESELIKGEGVSLQLKTVEDGKIYDTMIAEFDPKFKSQGINEVTDIIKIVVSNKRPDLETFKQDNLEVAERPTRGITRGMGSRKAWGISEEADWSVFSFSLRIAGPK